MIIEQMVDPTRSLSSDPAYAAQGLRITTNADEININSLNILFDKVRFQGFKGSLSCALV